MPLHNAFGELNLEATQQQILAAISADDSTTRSTFEAAQRGGNAFFASTGRVTVSPGYLRVTVTNPAGARPVYLSHLEGFFSAGPVYARLSYQPVTVLSAPPRPANNFRLGSAQVSAVQLRADTDVSNPVSGGTDTGVDFAFGGGDTTTVRLAPLSVPAGVTVALNVPVVGTADAVLTAYWWEEEA